MNWKTAAELYFHMAEWFAENEPGTPVPEWCELSWPLREESIEDLLELYKDKIEPSDIDSDEEFLAIFGMREMELAAKIIVDKCREKVGWETPIFCEDFKTDLGRTGFVELISSGWLKRGVDNGQFYVNDGFIQRLQKHYG